MKVAIILILALFYSCDSLAQGISAGTPRFDSTATAVTVTNLVVSGDLKNKAGDTNVWGALAGKQASGSYATLGANIFTGAQTITTATSPMLAIYNGTASQRMEVFGTRTDASNYRRGYITDSTAGVLGIGSEGLGTGATGNSIQLLTDGTARIEIDSSGNIILNGASGSQPVGFKVGGTQVARMDTSGAWFPAALEVPATAYIDWTGRSVMRSPSNGVIKFGNQAENDFTMIVFGGVTASFPAIKRVGTSVVARLADDSANTTVTATGIIDTSTATSVAVSATGWTNSFGIHSTVFLEGVAMTFVVYNNAGTACYTNTATVANATIPLQASGKVIVTAGTGVSGVAVPW